MFGILFASLIACGGKTPPNSSGDAAASSGAGASAVTGDFPTDAASRAFVEALTARTVTDFHAVDSGGAQVILSTLQFQGDNTWVAEGYVDAGEEQMECSERGTWTMEPARSPTEATIEWVIGSTDCIGRSEGDTTRALVTITGDDVEFALR
ncbi:MAG: hypothetical protein D6798_02865 [Deltaproteobacteria bacterium]|nr:MAG: hypothetical protein D6798_02865 [Deltaproteobacteria bacterium]